MNASVYIADIDIKLIPLNSKSRLHPIHKVLTRYPVDGATNRKSNRKNS
jgi:hypothetical protein